MKIMAPSCFASFCYLKTLDCRPRSQRCPAGSDGNYRKMYSAVVEIWTKAGGVRRDTRRQRQGGDQRQRSARRPSAAPACRRRGAHRPDVETLVIHGRVMKKALRFRLNRRDS